MAIITKGPNLEKGIEVEFTLNITDLLAHESVNSDAYFSTQSNWDKVFINYTSEGNQKEILIFENVDSGTSDSANFGVFSGARNTFEVQSIVVMDKQGGYLKIKRDLLTVEDFDVSFSNDIFTLLASDNPGRDRSGTFSYENNIITKTSAVDGNNLVIKSNEEASGDFSLEININTDGTYMFGMGADPFDSGVSLYPNHGIHLQLSTRYFWETTEASSNGTGIDFSSQPTSFAGYSFRFERDVSGNLKVFRKEPGGSSFIEFFDYGTVNGPLYFEYFSITSGSQLEIVSASGFSIPSGNTVTTVTWDTSSTGYGVYDVSNGGISGNSSSLVTQFGTNQASGPCYIEFTPQALSGRDNNFMGIAMTDSVASTTPNPTYVHTLTFSTNGVATPFSSGSYDTSGATTYAADGSEVFRIEILEDRVEYSKNGEVFYTDDQNKPSDLNGVFSGYPPYFPYFRLRNEWVVSDFNISGFSIPSQNSITSFTASPDTTGTFTFENNVITKTSSNAWDVAIRSDQVASGDFSVEVTINVLNDHFFGMGYDPIATGVGSPPDYGVYTDAFDIFETNGSSFNVSLIAGSLAPFGGDSLKWERESGNLKLFLKRSGESIFSEIFDYGTASETLYFQSQPNDNGTALEIISSTGFA